MTLEGERRDELQFVDDDENDEELLERRGSLDDQALELLARVDLEDEAESVDAPLPSHSCAYCSIHNPTAVIRCCTCSKWFCNGKAGGSGAHIVQHMVRSKHKELALHPGSLVGELTLECYACGNRNIFALGYVTGKEDPEMVVILCRIQCPHAAAKTGEWDPNTWTPLIRERAIAGLIMNVPNEADLLRAKKVTANDMARLEEAWKSGKVGAKVEDLPFLEAQEQHEMPVQLRYEDVYDFVGIFLPLVQLEADYDKELKESQVLQNVAIRWDHGLNQRRIAWVPLSAGVGYSAGAGAISTDPDFRITPGDEVEIKHPGTGWSGRGNIIEVPTWAVSEEIAVELTGSKAKAPVSLTSGFTLRFLWKSVPFDRMAIALKKFATDDQAVSPYILKKILGHEYSAEPFPVKLPTNLNIKGLPELNSSQIHAVRSVIGQPLSLIQGPPGTGKTVTSTAIVYHLAKMHDKGRILVVAPSNVAVDHLTEKIHSTGLRVVRIAAKCREAMQSGVEYLSLHEQIKNSPSHPELSKLIQLKVKTGHLSQEDEKKFIALRAKAEKDFLDAAEVVCCTCSGAGDKRLSGRTFRTVLIDEATQACEPECLIPIVKGARQVILVGDHRQLGPVILSKRAAKAGLGQSLFERLIHLGIRPVRLQIQYRMHPCLSEFPSNKFYDGSLENGVSSVERLRKHLDFPWFNPDIPMMFINCTGQEELSSSGTSYLNRTEALLCERLVTKLLKANTSVDNQPGILPSSIGIITPYEGQRSFCLQAMQIHGQLSKDLYMAVEVASVDAFQGREKDYIILSCVRANDHGGIGFLTDPRRLNVALTRAKYGLIVLGNARVLSKHHLWHHLIAHFKSKNLLLDGTVLTALRPSLMPLGRPPKPSHNDQYYQMMSQQQQFIMPDYEDFEYLRSLPELGNREISGKYVGDSNDDVQSTITLETQPFN